MAIFNASSFYAELFKRTSIFGLRLWVVIVISLGFVVVVVVALFLLSLCLSSRRRRSAKHRRGRHPKSADLAASPPLSKEIQEIVPYHAPPPVPKIQSDMGKVEHRVVYLDRHHSMDSRGTAGLEMTSVGSSGNVGPDVSHFGWGRRYTLRELEAATCGMCEENVIGESGYGIVYRGILRDGTKVAVKNLLNNRGQAEQEFKVEIETIGRVRHKNLVSLLGYCVEGAYRMLVYEYVDNGNLEQWLHGEIGEISPVTWNIRMNIILGAAKGLAYLHEGLEPKVVHRDVKSSNILLDRQWNPKVSDFGLAKLFCSERTHVTTRVVGTFGYVAPEYAYTGMLNEKSDLYSFGVLIMEVITGRSPVDYSRPKAEVNLVEWVKTMVGDRRAEEVVDPKLPDTPASKALKRVLLVALRCVDPDATKRPKMGQIIHMLEADDSLIRDGNRIKKGTSSSNLDCWQAENKHMNEGGSPREMGNCDSGRDCLEPTRWR